MISVTYSVTNKSQEQYLSVRSLMVSQWIPFWDSLLAENFLAKPAAHFLLPTRQQGCFPSGVFCTCSVGVYLLYRFHLAPHPMALAIRAHQVSLWFQVLAGEWRSLRSVGTALFCSSHHEPFLLWSFALFLLSNSYNISSPIDSRPHCPVQESRASWLLSTWKVVMSNWDVPSVKYPMGF